MTTPLERVAAIGIVPVVVIDDAARAADLAHALLEGGVGCAEFTLRTPAGLDAIAAAAAVPGFVSGAGTVLTTEQADAAADAGAAFMVSPGYDPVVADRVRGRGVAMLPGIATATEAQRAIADGFDQVKVFPVGPLGGTAYLDALAGPFPALRFLPSGGIRPDDLGDYLSRPHVLAASGSWMVPRDAIAAGDFDRVVAACAESAAVRDRARGTA